MYVYSFNILWSSNWQCHLPYKLRLNMGTSSMNGGASLIRFDNPGGFHVNVHHPNSPGFLRFVPSNQFWYIPCMMLPGANWDVDGKVYVVVIPPMKKHRGSSFSPLKRKHDEFPILRQNPEFWTFLAPCHQEIV